MTNNTYFVHFTSEDIDYTSLHYQHPYLSSNVELNRADIDASLLPSCITKQIQEFTGGHIEEGVSTRAPQNLTEWMTKNLLWLAKSKHFVYILSEGVASNPELHEMLTISQLWGFTSICIVPKGLQSGALLHAMLKTNICIGEADIGRVHDLVATL